jgi:hypothetical protein
MDAKDIRNLSEAYMEVYHNELDEGFKEFPSKKVYKQALKKPTGYEGDAQVDAMMNTRADFKNKTYDLAGKAKAKEAANRARGEAKRAAGKKKTFGNRLMRNEEQGYDVYDIILSHLLDEGYAETVEAAEVIMVNMSEDWRESIVEEMLDEGEKPLPYGRMMKKSNQLADKGEGKRAAKIYLAANAPKGPKVKVRNEATAMAKRGYDEAPIRQKIAKSTGGGEAADRATKLENQPTYGDANKAKQRQKLARTQRGDFRNTTSSNPGLHVGQHKSDDPKVKAKQAARGAQRGALTPREKKQLGR